MERLESTVTRNRCERVLSVQSSIDSTCGLLAGAAVAAGGVAEAGSMSAAGLLAMLRTIPDDTGGGVALPCASTSAVLGVVVLVAGAACSAVGAGVMLIAGNADASAGFGVGVLSAVGVAVLGAGDDVWDRDCSLADELDAVLAAASLANRRARI